MYCVRYIWIVDYFLVRMCVFLIYPQTFLVNKDVHNQKQLSTDFQPNGEGCLSEGL